MDLVIGILSCCTKPEYYQQILACNDTWCKKSKIPIYFFSGEECSGKCGENVVHLKNVGDDYTSAGFKQWYGMKFLYENHPKSKFYYIIGSDTYVQLDKILEYISSFNSNEYLYIGGHGNYYNVKNKKIYFHSGGCGFILSNSLMCFIYPRIQNWVESCFIPIYCCDVWLAYMLEICEIKINLIFCNNFRGCTLDGLDNKRNICCVSKRHDILNCWVCHYMTPKMMFEFEKILCNTLNYSTLDHSTPNKI